MRKHEKVICVKIQPNSHWNITTHVTIGKCYDAFDDYIVNCFGIINDINEIEYYWDHDNYFITLKQYRKLKLEKINKL